MAGMYQIGASGSYPATESHGFVQRLVGMVGPYAQGIDHQRVRAFQRRHFGVGYGFHNTTYWQVGRRIVEEDQHGAARAEYWSRLIAKLAEEIEQQKQIFMQQRMEAEK